jgi:replicative DNA helicase
MMNDASRVQVEAGYLAVCILTPMAYTRTADRAKDELFLTDKHKVILEAIRVMPSSEPWDVTTLIGCLRDHGKLQSAGDVVYLSGLLEFGFGSAESLLDTLESFYAKDQITTLCQDTLKATIDTPGIELLDRTEAEIIRIHSRLHKTGGFVKLSEVVPVVMDTIEKRMLTGKPVTGIPTGFPDLDSLCCGLQAGDLVVVAGYPSRGKSTLAEQVSFGAATAGYPSLFFSLEMSQQNVMDRAFSRTTGATLIQVRNGHGLREYAGAIAAASGGFSELPFWLDATPGMDINAILARARIAALQHRIRFVVVDYLQLIVGQRRRGDSQEAEISDTVRMLKNLARELDVPVMLLSQLRRPPAGVRDPEPTMFDLKGSGGIEAHADVVIFVHRPNFGTDKASQSVAPDRAEFIVGKQRNGPLGKVEVLYDARHVRFLSSARTPEARITDEGKLDDIPE